MVVKSVKFSGPNLADRQGLLSNFLCNDSDNLKFIPQSVGVTEGIAENTMRVQESNSPLWQKVSVGYKKTGTYGDHTGTIQIYGIDNLGLKTLIAEREILQTATAEQNYEVFDLLKSACTSSIDRLTENTLKGYLKISTSLLQDKYDDIRLTSPWYNSLWLYRKGIPYQNSLYKFRKYPAFDGSKNVYPDKGMATDFWYFVIDITYNAHMNADFSDLRFCGPDGITLMNHHILSYTASTTAKVLVLVPWYFGYEQVERDKKYWSAIFTGGVSNTTTYTNQDPKFFWMYYGNAAATTTSDATLGGNIWFNDDFDDGSISDWTVVPYDANAYATVAGTQLTMGTLNAASNNVHVFKQLDWTKTLDNTYDVIWKVDQHCTSGDAAMFLSTDTSVGAGAAGIPQNALGCWIDGTHVWGVQVLAGVATTWTAGALSFNHDSQVPLYVKIHIQRRIAANENNMTISISRDMVRWNDVVTLIKSIDLDSTLFDAVANYPYVGMRKWASAAGSIKYDWVKVIPTLQYKQRTLGWEENFQFTDMNYRVAGDNYAAGSKTWTLDAANKQINFAIAAGASALYDAGTYQAPAIRYPGITTGGYSDSLMIYETKLTAVARSTNGTLRPFIGFHCDLNKHFEIIHQLYQDANFDSEMRCANTYLGAGYLKAEQKFQKEPISEGPIWMRVVIDSSRRNIYSEYSRNSWDWIPLGVDNVASYFDADDLIFGISNNGSSNGTCTFNYVRFYDYACLSDYGRTLTAEQSYSQNSLLAAFKTTNEMGTYDDFEDGYMVHNELLYKCTNSINIARTCSYAGATTGFTANSSTISASQAVVMPTNTNWTLKVITSNLVNTEGAYTENFNVTPSTSYTAGVWIKGTAGKTLRIGIEEKDSAAALVGRTYGATTTLTGGWDYLTATRAFGSTGEKACIVIYTDVKQSSTFYASEIAVVAGSSIPSWYTSNGSTIACMNLAGHLQNNTTTRTYPLRPYEYHNNYGWYGTRTAPMYDSRTAANEMLAENQSTFETGCSWTGVAITASQSSTVAHSGTKSCKMDTSTAADCYAHIGGDYAAGTFRLGMQAGNFYTMTGWLYVSSAHGTDTSNGRSLRPVAFYDVGGVAKEIQGPDILTSSTQLDTWRYFEFPFWIPPNAVGAAIRMYDYGNSGAGKPIYWDDISLKKGLLPMSDSYSMLSQGNTADEIANQIYYSDNLVSKHIRFKWKQIYNDPDSGASSNYHRLYSTRVANEKDSLITVDVVNNSACTLRIVKYDRKSGTALSTATFYKSAGYLGCGGAASTQRYVGWYIDIFDDGQSLSIYRNGLPVITSFNYITAATPAIEAQPGQYSGFGSNLNAIAMWDDLIIEPWDGTSTEKTLMLAASSAVGFADDYVYTGTRDIKYMNNTYTWTIPTNFIRGQPLQLATKSRGASTYEYSKVFYGVDGGWWYLGPNGLDKYIGITTRINFNGTSSNALEINNITYDYDV